MQRRRDSKSSRRQRAGAQAKGKGPDWAPGLTRHPPPSDGPEGRAASHEGLATGEAKRNAAPPGPAGSALSTPSRHPKRAPSSTRDTLLATGGSLSCFLGLERPGEYFKNETSRSMFPENLTVQA